MKAFFELLPQLPKLIGDAIKESFRSVRSEDAPTRRASVFFVLSLVGLLFTLGLGGKYLVLQWQAGRAQKAALAKIEAERQAQIEEEKRRNAPPTYQSLGTFSLELREKPGVVRGNGGLNNVEMEVVAACDDAEVCEFVKKNLDLARGELSSLFVAGDRDKLLTPAGKKAFRDEIRDQINRWLEKAGHKPQVVDILFPRFIMS